MITHEPPNARARFVRENLIVVSFQLTAWAGCLTLLSQTNLWWIKALVLIFFCLMMQGVFSMMHESYHSIAHSNRKINYAIGFLTSTIFGTSATLFKINHMGHHVRNRTRAEMADYIFPDESALKKILMYYFSILGGIWLLGLVGSFFLAFLPYSALQNFLVKQGNNTYLQAFHDFQAKDIKRIRYETLAGVLFWLAAFKVFGWQASDVLMAYVGFAFSWSSLQWVYHMRTPIDVTEGAYNLRLPTVIRMLFLNFNYNLTHHRRPNLRWQELCASSDQKETRPLWYMYLLIFKKPAPLAEAHSVQKTYF